MTAGTRHRRGRVPLERGAGSGMRFTLQNAAMLLSMGLFFSIVIAALAAHLPSALAHGLQQAGLSAAACRARGRRAADRGAFLGVPGQ